MSWEALGSIVFWGLSFIATKVALEEFLPSTVLALRFGIGAILLFLIQFRRDRQFLKAFSFRDWVQMALLAAVGIVGHTLLQSYALLYTTAIDTGWIVAIQPVFITLAGRLFLGEVITGRKVLGMALGFFGVYLIISKGVFSLLVFRFVSTAGDLLVLSSAITWTVFTVGGRGFVSRFPPLVAITPIMMLGFALLCLLSTLQGGWSGLSQAPPQTWLAVLFLGVFCSGLAYLFWYSALGKRDSSSVGMYLYLEPFATLIGATFILHERIGGVTVLGGFLTLFGVYLTTRRPGIQKS